MKTFLKVILIVLLLVVIITAGLFVYAKYFFDPNSLKTQITSQVKERSGRDITIEGDLKLSVFPWINLEIGKTVLNDDASWDNETLLTFDQAKASVKLRPLLSKQIELGTTEIEGLNLTLIQDKDGNTNWQAFTQAMAGKGSTPDAAAEQDGGGFATQTLGAIKMTDAGMTFVDRSTGETMTFSRLNLTTGELLPNEPFSVDLEANMAATNASLDVTLDGVLTLFEERLSMEQPTLTVSGNHYAVPFKNFTTTIRGSEFETNLADFRLSQPEIEYQVEGGKELAGIVNTMAGTLTAKSMSLAAEALIVDAPNFTYEGALDGKPVGALKGDFVAASLSRKGSTTIMDAPTLKLDSAMTHETVQALTAKLSSVKLTVKNDTAVALNSPRLDATFNGSGVPGNTQQVDLTANTMNFGIDKGSLKLDKYTLAAMDMNVQGNVNATSVFEPIRLGGTANLAPFNLRKLLTAADIAVDTSDSTALSEVKGNTEFSYADDKLMLNNMSMTVDGSQVTGDVTAGANSRRMNLSIDKLNLDRYLPPPEENETGESREVDAIDVPAQTLRELNLNGNFKVGSLMFGGIESRNVEVGLKANNGNVRVNPARAQLYGGTYSGDIGIDATGEVPTLSLNEKFNNVDFGAITRDIANSDRLKGRVTGSLVMTATGHNTAELRATSNGRTEFAFTDGVLEGVNMMETVRNIVALANKEPRVADEPDRTEFRKLSGTATIYNGVLTNDDLTMEVPLLRMTGAGTLDLNNNTIDYRVGTRVVQEGDIPLEKELRFLSDYSLPVYISGTFDAPVIDNGRAVGDLAKQYAKKRVTDAIFDRLGLGDKEPVVDPEAPDTPPADGEQAPAAEKPVEEAPPLTPEEEADKQEEELKDELDQKLKDVLKDIIGG